MTTAVDDATPSSGVLRSIAQAGTLTAFTDGCFSSALSIFAYGSTVPRLFQGVASVLVGPHAINGGAFYTALGLAMHICVAFAWSIVFALLARSGAVRRMRSSRGGVMRIAAIYGPFVWVVMSLAVIPALTGRAPSINRRWWVQLVGHFPFVGLPIVASVARK